jgi:quercetin dioxygenase-like cupin family protein
MKYARLFCDDEGESHFDDLEVETPATSYVTSAQPLGLSGFTPASQFAFMKAPSGWVSDWHASSAPNMFFVLSGEWEVTAGDGETRRFATGSVLLVEDTKGRGHTSRVVTESLAVVVQLSE